MASKAVTRTKKIKNKKDYISDEGDILHAHFTSEGESFLTKYREYNFEVPKKLCPDQCLAFSSQWVVGENGVLKPKRVNPNVYQPPSLKGWYERHSFYRWWSCVLWFFLVFKSFFCFTALRCRHFLLAFQRCMWQMGGYAVKGFISFFFIACARVICIGGFLPLFYNQQQGPYICVWRREEGRKREIRVWQLWDTEWESRKVWIIQDYSQLCIQLWHTRTHTYRHN